MRVTSRRDPSSRHCARARPFILKKCRSNGELLATLYPILPIRDLKLRPSASRTNALMLDQLAGGPYSLDIKLCVIKKIAVKSNLI